MTTKKRSNKSRNRILKIAHQCRVSAMQISLASDSQPVPQQIQDAVRNSMLAALTAIRTAEQPSIQHWKAAADATNIAETLLTVAAAHGDASIISTAQNSIKTAIDRQRQSGGVTRLDGPGLHALQKIIDFVIEATSQLTHKAYLLILRDTDLRLRLKTQSTRPPEGTVFINAGGI